MNEAVRALSARRKAIILASCCLSLLIVSMDATIVNVAAPAIRADLGASGPQLQWVIDIYNLVLASLLLLAGAIGDRFGRRRTFQTGLAIFALASLLCSMAPDVNTLIAARFLQAVGGSMLNPVALSIISQVFTGRVERARAIGVWGAVIGISMSLGPIVGGALIELNNWRAVFWINVPICVVAIVLTAVFVPESKSVTMRGIDPIGQGLGVLFLFGVVYVLIEGPDMGWTDARTVVVLIVAVISLLGFLRWEARCANPFIDLRFFRSVPFSSATVIGLFQSVCWGAFLLMMSLYLQQQRGYSAVQTGLFFLPLAGCAIISAPLSGHWVGRYGGRPSLLVSGAMFTGASLLLAVLTVTTPVWVVLVVFAMFGIAFGAVNAAVTTAAISGMPTDRAGAASGIASTSRQVGASIGVALCGTVAGSALVATGVDLAAAARPLWLLCAGLGVVIFVLGIASTSPRALRTAEKLAALHGEPHHQLEAVGAA